MSSRIAVDRGRQLLDEPGLPHPGDADDRDELRLALGARATERAEQLVELAGASDEPRARPQLDVDAER